MSPHEFLNFEGLHAWHSFASFLCRLRCLTLIHRSPAPQPQGSLHAWEPRDGSAAVSSPEQGAPGTGVVQQPSAALRDADKVLQRQSELPASSALPSASPSASASAWGSYLPQSVREAWHSMHDGGGAIGLTQTQVLATAAGAAVLLYAGMLIFPVSSSICQLSGA